MSGLHAASHTFVNFQDAQVKVCKTDTEGDPIAGWGVSLEDDDQVNRRRWLLHLDRHAARQLHRHRGSPHRLDRDPAHHARLRRDVRQPLQSHTFVNFQNAQVKVCKTDTEGDPIAGWGVSLEDDHQVTGADGCYTWTVTQPGTYTATEEARTGWTATLPITHDFVVTSGGTLQSHTFVNFQNAQVKVCKTDTEGDPIAGWGVSLEDDDQVTGADGCYTWTVTQPGTYTATEEARTGWTATLPITHDFVVISGSALQSHTFVNFQNAQVKVCKTDTEGDPIAGWGVSLEDDDQVTGADGCYTWTVTHPVPTPPPKKPAPAGQPPCPSPTTSS